MPNNDNRNYNYSGNFTENRPEYNLVVGFVPEKSTVIDLGCGEGSLMQKLIAEKQCSCTGIEISASGVEVCKQKGLNVLQGEIDKDMPFADNEFDISLCNVTLQMVLFPEKTIQEMKRVASAKLIISFPNFAYWLNRLEMLFKGRMPKKLLFGYSWYATGHIHQFSLKDIKQLINETGQLKIKTIACVPSGIFIVDVLAKWLPNLFGKIIILEIEKE
jgi:methionine biosynthesis protein MetW